MALPHLFHADDEPRLAIAFGRYRDLEIEVGVDEIRLVLAQVVGDAAGPARSARCRKGRWRPPC